MTVDKIKEYVLTDTPCYPFKAALKSLELNKQRAIRVANEPPGRKPGPYPDERLNAIDLRFEKPLFASQE